MQSTCVGFGLRVSATKPSHFHWYATRKTAPAQKIVLQEYKPGIIVSDFVRTYQLVNFEFKHDCSLPAKAYPPKAEHCLSFYARDYETIEYQRSKTKTGNLSTVLFRQQTEVTNRYVGNNFLLIQVVFKPGGLYRITGIPSNLLTNQYLDAETFFSKEIKIVNSSSRRNIFEE